MTVFQILAALLLLTAISGYINHKYIKCPTTIGHMAFAFMISLLAIALDKAEGVDLHAVSDFVKQIDFSRILLHGMLAFLLFAGALHIKLEELNDVKWSVAGLATAGVLIATFVTGTLVWLAAGFLGFQFPYLYGLLFGALISPTDPIAVLAILKDAGISKRLYVKIGGESLFNDGVGVVVFLAILGLATTGASQPDWPAVTQQLLRVALGGAALGLFLGWITYRLLRSIDAYRVEVVMTLALATCGYVLAEMLDVSAPICMVTAGLVIGNKGRLFGMTEKTRERLDLFWELLDEIMNAVLFLLIGLEIIVISVTLPHIALGLLAILAVLSGRVVSISLPMAAAEVLRRIFGWKHISFLTARAMQRFGLPQRLSTLSSTALEWRVVGLLTWGGLRGGLSVAMALSLPEIPEKAIILPVTYIVVLFSILVQGLTFKPALKFLVRP